MADNTADHCGNSDNGAVTVSFSKGKPIFTQGDTGDDIYLLLTGQVVLRQRANGRDCDLTHLHPGDIFGEMGVLGDKNRLASAIAVEDCTVAVLPAAAFRRRIERNDHFVAALIRLFAQNIADAHRLFLRRPRSLHDHTLLISSCFANLRRFAQRSERHDAAQSVLDILNRMDEALAELIRQAQGLSDRRTDILIDPEDHHGIGIDQVIRSDSRRQYKS